MSNLDALTFQGIFFWKNINIYMDIDKFKFIRKIDKLILEYNMIRKNLRSIFEDSSTPSSVQKTLNDVITKAKERDFMDDYDHENFIQFATGLFSLTDDNIKEFEKNGKQILLKRLDNGEQVLDSLKKLGLKFPNELEKNREAITQNKQAVIKKMEDIINGDPSRMVAVAKREQK